MTDQKELTRNIYALCLMTLSYAAFQGICQTIVPLSMAHLAFTKTTIGLIQAVPGIIAIFLGAPIARIANTRWRRETLTTCFVLIAIASLLYSRAARPSGFILPQLMFGLAGTSFWTNMVATSLRLSSDTRKRHQIQAYATALQGIGAFGGPLLGGYLSTYGFAYGFYAGVLCAATGLVASRFLSRSVAIEPPVDVRRFFTGAYAKLFRVVTRRPIVIIGMSYVALNCFLLYVMGGSFYLLYAGQIGLSAFVAAALVSGREGISALVRLSFGVVSRRIPPIVLLGAGTVLGVLSLSLLPLSVSLIGVGLIAVAQGMFLAYLPPAVNTLVGTSTTPDEQSIAISAMNASNFIAQTTMSPLLGFALTSYGYTYIYPGVGGIWIVLALFVLRDGLRRMGSTRSDSN